MKKLVQFFLLSTIMLLSFSINLLAQDSTAVSDNPILSLIPESWYGYITVLLLVYEFAVRAYPTIKNYSIINKVVQIIAWMDKSTNKLKRRNGY